MSITNITEDQHQKLIIQWAEYQRHDNRPLSDYLHHSPNGELRPTKESKDGKRYSPTANKLKAMGTRRGWPDLQLAIAASGYHGLYIELKQARRPKSKGAKVEIITDGEKPNLSQAKDHQIEVITMLNQQGNLAAVVYGYDAAVELIQQYLSGKRIVK